MNIWDCGEGAIKKYGHLFPACKEGALGVLPVFSCTDRSSWEDIPDLLQRYVQPTDTITPIGRWLWGRGGGVISWEIGAESIDKWNTDHNFW